MSITISSAMAKDFLHILPLITVAGWACLTLLADALGRARSASLGPFALLGLLAGLAVTLWSWTEHAQPAGEVFGGMIVMDRFALFLDAIFILAAILTTLLSGAYLRAQRFAHGEHFSLLLLTVTGMMLLVHAGDFVVFVIGLETMSVSVYAMTASWTGNRKSAEAGLKYFIMGAVATAFLLYGIALIYGVTGQTGFRAIAEKASSLGGSAVLLLGMFMVLGALGFKVALVPFHAWTPDVYEGAPTTVTGFMATAVKAAGFGALIRVFLTVFGDDAFVFGRTGWANILWVLAALTMTIGNLTALRQSNVKRMLAYSSISHAGYLLLGVLAAATIPGQGSAPVLYYLLAYTVTTIGAFGLVAWLGSHNDERTSLDDWAGLAAHHPVAAAAMTVFLLSLGGIPPTAGFFAKFYIFRAALANEQLLWLVIIAVLNSVVSIYYYLKPVVAMYFREEGRAATPVRGASAGAALVIAALLVLLLGLIPGQYLDWATQSMMVFVGR